MDFVSQLAPAFCAGLSGAALLWMWRKCASRWNNAFPLVKKALELSLWAWAIASAGWFLYAVGHAPDFKLALVAGLTGFAVPAIYNLLKSRQGGKDEVKRGTNVATAAVVKRQVKANRKPTRLEIGGVPIPFDSEPYHLLFAGSTGTGKSVAINQVLDQLRAANDTVILVDSGGGFMEKHYRADTDFVFNPFDARCVNWSPVLEMQGEWDAEAMARSIVPDGVGDSKEWNGYAQTLVSCVLRQLWSKNKMTLRDFLYYVQAATVPELKELLQGTAAMAQLSSEKTFGSIRTIAANYLTPYAYLPNAGEPFSVSEMIRQEHSGFLYVTYRDDQLDSLRALIACVLDVAARTILSMPPDENRRIWLVLDEFASIGRVQSIEAVATKARKAGGCLLLGVQSVSQLRDRYGEFGAQTILSCLSSWLVLRCADADTSEYMSRYIGDVELLRKNRSSSTSDTGDSTSQNEQQATQRALLPSQIQGLPNLQGFLKLTGNYPICQVKLELPAKRRPTTAAAFVGRDFTKRPMLKLVADVPAADASTPPRPEVGAAAKPKAPVLPLGGAPLLPVHPQATAPAKAEVGLLPADSKLLVSRAGPAVKLPGLDLLRRAPQSDSSR
ncbi:MULTISPECIES: type IV secretion system DNA-binding domain-containing protein [unclassified Variovorax]|uniref:type IV secretion system DNA-binding domain-containing protein n=1 Tax=unclassified Variovorax TaxID=663243 RepID=UPI0013173938|nr:MULTISPECIES: type IV secretion system DNA-binding domain-containing protein [unclassified Variovorax]VTU42669.1 DNA transport protein TraD [Variovorax sp. PBL-H6]VTU43763.1 DNA transport protein TraD [Variovorax sp. SRS16]VTU43831.1 DNA transport protein TraD [Variovorax sp. PBL-E5]